MNFNMECLRCFRGYFDTPDTFPRLELHPTTINGRGPSEGRAQPLAFTKATSHVARRGQMEDLKCRTTSCRPGARFSNFLCWT